MGLRGLRASLSAWLSRLHVLATLWAVLALLAGLMLRPLASLLRPL